MYYKSLVLLIVSLAMLSVAGPGQAQEGPSERVCILLGMLGAPGCDEEEDEDEPAGTNTAGPARISHSTVLSLLPDSFFEVIPRSSSTLFRSPNGLTATLDLARQLPNQATTMWWIIYNNPESCASTPCTFDDFANEEVQASFFTTGGRVSDRFGHVRLEGVVFAGAGRPGPAEPEGLGPGLLDPLGAEVHLASRTHGRDADTLAELGELENALSTLFGGGCPFDTLDPEADNPNGCTDPTISFHLP